MRKISMLNRVSIDGYFASSNENTFGMDWFVQDPAVDMFVRGFGEGSASPVLLLGGVTYRGFEKSWVPRLTDPATPPPLKAVAEELTKMTKLVFSRTLTNATWANTTLYKNNLVVEVKKIKEEPGADIMIMGSGSIIQQLANAALIDEYVFVLTPVIAGKGKPLFKEVTQSGLKLITTKSFDSGNVVLRYQVK